MNDKVDFFKIVKGSAQSLAGTWLKKGLIKYKNIFLLAVDGFVRDMAPLRASALTFYTMLSIVPVIAMLFGVAKGFGFESVLEEQLLEQIPQQETMMLQVIEFAKNMLAQTKGGVVAGIGIVVLFFTVIKMIANIEDSFNHIWKVEKGRTVVRKINDYLSLILLAPILLIISSSITVYVKTTISGLTEYQYVPNQGIDVALHLLNYLPFLILWGLFTFVFIFLPNIKVNFKPGIIAGLITAVSYHIVQWGYISLQIGVSSYNVIYGGFAALPLFVIWLQITWTIVLFGSELSFFIQHHEAYRYKEKLSEISIAQQKVLALKVTHLIVNEFSRNAEPLTSDTISTRLSLPITVVITLLSKLKKSRVIVESQNEQGQDVIYFPAQDINRMTIASVLEDFETSGLNKLPFVAEDDIFYNIIRQFSEAQDNLDDNRLVKDISIA